MSRHRWICLLIAIVAVPVFIVVYDSALNYRSVGSIDPQLEFFVYDADTRKPIKNAAIEMRTNDQVQITTTTITNVDGFAGIPFLGVYPQARVAV